jgi:hypothetical protein
VLELCAEARRYVLLFCLLVLQFRERVIGSHHRWCPIQVCRGAARAAGCGGSTTCARTSNGEASRSRRRTPSSACMRSSGTGTLMFRMRN